MFILQKQVKQVRPSRWSSGGHSSFLAFWSERRFKARFLKRFAIGSSPCNLALIALAQHAAMGSVRLLHLSGTKTSILKT